MTWPGGLAQPHDGVMANYRLLTTWRLPARRDDVWDVLADAEGWPAWWPSVRRVEPISEGNADGIGRVLRFTFTTKLPYALSFEARLTEMTRPVRMAAEARGELTGTWLCELDDDAGVVAVRNTWDVSTTRPWMNALAPLARPLFVWNHDALMREAGMGLARRLGTTVEVRRG